MQRFLKRAGMAQADPEKTLLVQKETGLCAQVAALLCARGIDTPSLVKRFLHPGPEQFHDPLLLPDMEKAVGRLRAAITQRERITIFCDYDADGTTGGCALYRFLKSAGADVAIQTPNRHREGYGLSTAAIAQIAEAGNKLVVTVDCGITNIEETAYARSLGLDVIITDHHECGDTLPDTPYVINAKRPGSVYPDANLAGCGVAFKLIHALSSLAEAMRYIDLIAIGTITDIVPLLGENRAIAHMGLQRLRTNPSAGVAALAQAAGLSLTGLTSQSISFGLGPRINAAGRMDTAHLAIDVLKAVKPGAALSRNAQSLCALNDRRRQEVDEILADAQAMIDAQGCHSDPMIMLASPGWNAGVIGIAAAKVAERYARPCVLFGGEDSFIGSARSIEGVNIYEALAAFSERYEKFGGHAQAAGLTIAPEILPLLRSDICRYLQQHYDESVFVHRRVYDISLRTEEITHTLIKDLNRLEPFGEANEKPSIAVMDAALKAPRFVGKGNKPHLKLTLAQGKNTCNAIAFFYKDTHALVPERADFLCEAGLDDFSGKPQLIVRCLAFKYSEALAESFLSAYNQSLLNGFIDEVTQLDSGAAQQAMTQDDFCSRLREALAQSRFGLSITVATRPAFEFLLSLTEVKAAVENERLVLWDEKTYTPENCIACSRAAGHPRMLRVGVSAQAPALWTQEVKAAYRSHAKSLFLTREQLLVFYKKLCPLLKIRPRTAEELAEKLGVDNAQAVFALRVFVELELLETDKSGRISAIISGGPKKELRQSACYKAFEDLING